VLNHLTLPVPSTDTLEDGPFEVPARKLDRRGATGGAVLLSTLSIRIRRGSRADTGTRRFRHTQKVAYYRPWQKGARGRRALENSREALTLCNQ